MSFTTIRTFFNLITFLLQLPIFRSLRLPNKPEVNEWMPFYQSTMIS